MSRLHSLVHSRLVALFGIDLRALAAFRITLALLLVIDIASRLRLLTANYTDAGAHPREAALAHYALDELPSLYMLGGARWLALALLLATGAAALLLGLGWRTRLVTLLTWLLVDSLHSRHLLLLDGGDHLLRNLLFFSLFAPLGALWSLDARRRGPPAGVTILSPGSAVLLLQLGCVFLVTGLTKSGPEWLDGTAIQYALARKWWIRPFGSWLLGQPALPPLLTPAVRWYEILGALALFAPFWTRSLRTLAVLGFWGLLAGLGLGLRLNLFPWIVGTGMLLFLPTPVWDTLGRRLAWLRMPAAGPSAPAPPAERALQLVALALLPWLLWANAGTVDRALAPPEPLRSLQRFVHAEQGWLMYAPSPRHVDVWLEHRGKLASHALVVLDEADGGPGWDTVRTAWRDYRFQYALQKQTHPKWRELNPYYARWLCRQWNLDHTGGERLASVTVTAVVQPIALPGETPEPMVRRTLASLACPP